MPRGRPKGSKNGAKNKRKSASEESECLSSYSQFDDCVSQSAASYTNGRHHKNILLKNLKVYTKKLDEMKVILDSQIPTDYASFFEQILAESKPKAPVLLKHRKHRKSKSERLMSYIKLKSKIHRVNSNIARRDLKLKKTKKKGMQKSIPLKSVAAIVRFKTKAKIPKSNVKKNNKIVQTTEESSKEPEYTYRNSYLIFNNIKTTETDVYYVNSAGMVEQHYHTKNGREDLYRFSPAATWLPYCCWYKRQNIMTKILGYLPELALKFMSAAHRCEGQCTCCCEKVIHTSGKAKSSRVSMSKVKEDTSDTTHINSEIPVTHEELNVLIDNMLKKCPTVLPMPSLIQKAFAFTPQEKTKKTIIKKSNSVLVTQILFSYKDGNEYYKIGSEGEMSQYLRNVSQAFIQEHVVSDESAINENVCCLFARDKLIHAWRNIKILPSTAKYMKTQHTYTVQKCVECNQLVKSSTNSNHLKKLALRDVPNYTSEVCVKLPSFTFTYANHLPTQLDASNSVNKTLPHDEDTLCTQENKDPASSNENPLSRSIAPDAVTENETDVHDTNFTERRRLICLHTIVMLEKSLNKLKHVSVHIKSGKIYAILNVPVTNLTTNELKTLSNILTQAQKDIDDLQQTADGDVNNDPGDNLIANTDSTDNSVNTNDRDHNTALETAKRKHLYSTFSRSSSIHNAVNLKSFRVFVNSKIQKLKNKASVKKPLNNQSSETIPAKKKRIVITIQSEKAAGTKSASNTNLQKSHTTKSNKTKPKSKTPKANSDATERTESLSLQEQPSEEDPLNITSYDLADKKCLNTKRDPLDVPGEIMDPIDFVSPTHEMSYGGESSNKELPLINDDDCILGA